MQPVVGPLTNSLSSLELFMDSYISGQPWLYDPALVPIPWRKSLAEPPTRPLRIGYYVDDGVVRTQPPFEVGVKKVVDALKRAGHEGMFP